MTEQPIQRNRYFDPPTFECDVNGRNLDEDIQNFHLLSSQAQLASLHDWGIAKGLEVSGTLGSSIITINPGVAVDAQGRLIVLTTEGRGDLGSNPPGGNHNSVTVPVELDTSTFAEDIDTSYYLTIEFSEIINYDDGGTDCGRFEQAPWLRLQSVATFRESGTAIVLAIATLNPQGELIALKTQDPTLPYHRRLIGKKVEQLQICTSQLIENQIQQVSAGKLEPKLGGGLQLSVPKTSDEILLTQEAGKQFAKLEVRADTLEIKATDQNNPTWMSGLSIHANKEVGAVELRATADSFLFNTGDPVGKKAFYIHQQGNVGIGTTTPTAKLEVNGTVKATSFLGDQGAHFSTNKATTPLSIGRDTRTNKEVVKIGVDDKVMQIHYINDEEDNRIQFRLQNTDTEQGGGKRANDKVIMTLWGNQSGGSVSIHGQLNKPVGSFLIDHPLDPVNKTLRHGFVESPEDLCLYRGKVKLNADGRALVQMPSYFAALTKENEATVCLTPVGKKP